ncbi:DUF1194 domain-containing protein [Maritimibacter sp. 55A14]|uniref:DUF1194 domain-containing protein n=1 Tax=Maritimibacter sp. 55A14 TaxID=2174844 RepID=UPI001304D14C|nr:DUF1194 domain-containing protein [Maritimibacter sp. 55A14]
MRRARALALCLALGPAPAAACRLALVLALDVSASVDTREFGQQTEGLSRALDAPEVREILLDPAAPPVALAVFQWSGAVQQAQVLGWTLLDSEAAIRRIAAQRRGNMAGRTAIGAAMTHAATLLQGAPACGRATLDISGDGRNNSGIAPNAAARALPGVTVNGLVIGGALPLDHSGDIAGGVPLAEYYLREVIRGPGAFVETAADYGDYERAMRAKLLREVGHPVVGARRPAPRRTP